jgi:hypothetical protein
LNSGRFGTPPVRVSGRSLRRVFSDVGKIGSVVMRSILMNAASLKRDRPPIARQSTWQVRVKQDGKGSRGIWIMPRMIVADKRYVDG